MKRVVVALSLIVTLTSCSSSSDVDPTETIAAESSVVDAVSVIEISVTVGEDSGPDRKEVVALGATVRISLVNDGSDDDFHLHGYDIASGEVPAGEAAVIEFVADAAGEFELESHVTGDVLLVITVQE
jgi:hypothetical protein